MKRLSFSYKKVLQGLRYTNDNDPDGLNKKDRMTFKARLKRYSNVLGDQQTTKFSSRTSLIITSLTINTLSLAVPIMTLQVYDRILINHHSSTLYALAFGVLIALSLELALRALRSYTIGWSSAIYEHNMSVKAMKHIMGANPADIMHLKSGEYLQRMTSIRKLCEFHSGQSLVAMIEVPFIAVYLGLFFFLAGVLALVPLVLILLFCGVAWFIGMELRKAIEKRDDEDDLRYSLIIEAMSGIHTIKTMGLESVFQRRYEWAQKNSSKANYYVSDLSAQIVNYSTLFTQLMMIAVVSVGSLMVVKGGLTIGGIAACILLSGRIMQPLQRALGIWVRFQGFKVSEEKTNQILEMPFMPRRKEVLKAERKGRLQLNNVCFDYDSTKAPEDCLLKNINLDLSLGDSISIHNCDGSGTSTLLNLMMGTREPLQGSVYIDGIDAHYFAPEVAIKHIGYLASIGVIFRGSIRDNITTFRDEKMDLAYEMADLLDLNDFITKLPMGYDTVLLDSPADPISPGFKQRIAIARVLVNKPRIILFDNADRAFDKNGYNTVYSLLGRLCEKVTLIIVSDDRNILSLANREYAIENGHLVEKPRFDQQSVFEPFKELRI